MIGSSEALRIACLCLALASAETLHGIARMAWLAPRLGKARALRIGAVSGSLLAFLVCWLLVPGIGLVGVWPHLWLGVGLAASMAAVDVFIGRVVMRLPWRRIGRDFNPASGNWLSLALLVLVLLPALVGWMHGDLHPGI